MHACGRAFCAPTAPPTRLWRRVTPAQTRMTRCCAGNAARAADNPAAAAALTAAPAPFVISASRHAHSVQGLLEAMALQRMVELSQQAAAAGAAAGELP